MFKSYLSDPEDEQQQQQQQQQQQPDEEENENDKTLEQEEDGFSSDLESSDSSSSSSSSSDGEFFNLRGEFQEDDPLTISQLHAMTEEEAKAANELLEYDYEPGISLSSLEFGSVAGSPMEPGGGSGLEPYSSCILCGVDYETGKRTNNLASVASITLLLCSVRN